MREHFLFFLWRYQLYEKGDLKTTDGRALTVVHPGHLNHDAGPDFLNGSVILEGVQWHGHIEIHVQGGDWMSHGHQHDAAFQNVILHVVYDQKKVILDHNGRPLPTLRLRHRIPLHLVRNQTRLMASKSWVPCSGHLKSVKPITRSMTIHQAAISRLTSRANQCLSRLHELQGDWWQLAYEIFLRAMGFKVNGDAFDMLARATPYRILLKNLHDPLRLEALLIGQANLLDKQKGNATRLKKEYDFLRSKYGLHPLRPGVCRFMRTRPGNFPDLRLSQAVGILSSSPNVMADLLETLDRKALVCLVGATPFDHGRQQSRKGLGPKSRETLLINTIAPLHFAMAIKKEDEMYKEKVLAFLAEMAPEQNHILRKWSHEGMKAVSALESQGLLHLYETSCVKKRCLECPIGMSLVKDPDSAPAIP